MPEIRINTTSASLTKGVAGSWLVFPELPDNYSLNLSCFAKTERLCRVVVVARATSILPTEHDKGNYLRNKEFDERQDKP